MSKKTKAPPEIWLLEDPDTTEDEEHRIFWSPDSDCRELFYTCQVIGHYLLKSNKPEISSLTKADLKAFFNLITLDTELSRQERYDALAAVENEARRLRKDMEEAY